MQNSAALGSIITEVGGTEVVTENPNSGTTLYCDINAYVPEGAIITDIDVDFHFNGTGGSEQIVTSVRQATFGSAPGAATFSVTESGLGTSRATQNFDGTDITVDKNQKNYITLAPTWTGGGTFYVYGIRVNFTHQHMKRGG